MNNLLLVLSSPRGAGSYSGLFARRIVDDLKMRHPGLQVTVRNVARNPLPHLSEAFVNGIALPADRRSPAATKDLAVSDELIDELLAADILVVAAPVYNFGIPSSLKAWIDHVVREGRTYSVSDRKPQGLLKCRKAFVVVSRMGSPFFDAGGGLDHQESYLRQILGLIGIFSIDVVRVEAFGMESARRVTVASANPHVDGLLREFAQHLA